MEQHNFSTIYTQIHPQIGRFELNKLEGGASNEALNTLIEEIEARGYRDADDDTNREPGAPIVAGANLVPLYRYTPKTAIVWLFE